MNKSILALALIAALGAGNAQAAKPKATKAKTATAAKATEQAAPTISVKEAEDSLSRSLARIYGASINKMYKERKVNTSKDKFLEGYKLVAARDTSDGDYLDGLAFGMEVLRTQIQMKKQQKIDLNRSEFSKELEKTMADTTVLNDGQLRLLNNDVQKLMNSTEQIARESDPEAIANKKAGAEYIASLLKQKGYKQTESGLVYKVITAGKGDNFKASDVVKIKYKGTHINGTTFDENKEGAEMGINNFVPGFKEALQLMNPGCKLLAVIPGDLAYGVRGGGKGVIGPNETLIFEIETPEAAKKPEDKKADAPKGPKGPKGHGHGGPGGPGQPGGPNGPAPGQAPDGPAPADASIK